MRRGMQDWGLGFRSLGSGGKTVGDLGVGSRLSGIQGFRGPGVQGLRDLG